MQWNLVEKIQNQILGCKIECKEGKFLMCTFAQCGIDSSSIMYWIDFISQPEAKSVSKVGAGQKTITNLLLFPAV